MCWPLYLPGPHRLRESIAKRPKKTTPNQKDAGSRNPAPNPRRGPRLLRRRTPNPPGRKNPTRPPSPRPPGGTRQKPRPLGPSVTVVATAEVRESTGDSNRLPSHRHQDSRLVCVGGEGRLGKEELYTNPVEAIVNSEG